MSKSIYLFTIVAAVFSCSFEAFALKVANTNIASVATVRETYDDNITFAPTNEKKDFVTRFGYGLKGVYEGKKSTVSFGGDLNYDLFSRYEDYNNFSQSAYVNGNYEISKYDRVTIGDSFNHAQEPRSLDDALGSNYGRYSYYQNSFYAAYFRDLGPHLIWGVNYNNGLYLYTRDDLADNYTNGGGTNLEYAFSSRTALAAYYDFSRRDFDPGSDAITHAATLGLRRNITEQLVFNGKVGANFLESYNNKRYTKPSFFLSLNDKIDERTSAGISFSKSYSTTSYYQDIFNSWRISANFAYELSVKIILNGSAFYGKGRYEESGVKDELYGVDIGLGYDWSDNTRFTLGYGYSRVLSNDQGRQYSRNNVSLGVRVAW